MPYCLTCGSMVDELDSAYYARSMLCIPCWSRKCTEISMVSCGRCGTRVRQEEARQRRGSLLCGYCASELERQERIPECPLCRKPLQTYEQSVRLAAGQLVHSACALSKEQKKAKARCSICGKETDFFKILPGARVVCAKCDREGASSSHDNAILTSLVDRIGAMLG